MAGADAWGCGSAATRVLRLDPRAAAAAVDDGEGDPATMGHVEGADAVEEDDDDGAAGMRVKTVLPPGRTATRA